MRSTLSICLKSKVYNESIIPAMETILKVQKSQWQEQCQRNTKKSKEDSMDQRTDNSETYHKGD